MIMIIKTVLLLFTFATVVTSLQDHRLGKHQTDVTTVQLGAIGLWGIFGLAPVSTSLRDQSVRNAIPNLSADIRELERIQQRQNNNQFYTIGVEGNKVTSTITEFKEQKGVQVRPNLAGGLLSDLSTKNIEPINSRSIVPAKSEK